MYARREDITNRKPLLVWDDPFFPHPTQNSSLHFRNTSFILFTVGFPSVSVSPTPFQGLAVWLSTDEREATRDGATKPRPGASLRGRGRLPTCLLTRLSTRFPFNRLRSCALTLLSILYRKPKPHKTPSFGCYAGGPGDE